MRIVYIVHQFYPEFASGTERVTLGLARAAQRAGHHVQVLACVLDRAGSPGRPSTALAGALEHTVEGVPVMLVDRSGLPALAETSLEADASQVEAIAAWMRAQRFEVAHVMHTMRNAASVMAARRAGLPLVLTLTDYFLGCLRVNLIDLDGQVCDGPGEGRTCARRCPTPVWGEDATVARYRQARALLDAAAVCVAPSADVARRFTAMFPGLRCRVIGHGVDLLMLGQAAAEAAAQGRSTPAAAGDKPPLILGFFGTIVPAKGLDVLLQALAAAPELAVELWVIGAHHGDSAYRQRVDRLAAADPRVRMVGPLSPADAARRMAGIELLCLPSVVPETYSLVLHEAAALGVPALVSSLGAPAEAVQSGGGGEVVPAGDVARWTAAIRRAAADADLRARWRAATRLPPRLEEEGFLYDVLYRRVRRRNA